MDSCAAETAETPNEKTEESDQDPKPNIPLRQRRLPASFWQEPCPSQSPYSQEVAHSPLVPPSPNHYPIAPLNPWTVNANAVLPVFLPSHVTAAATPSHLLLHRNSNPQWVRGCCTCAACLNYSYVIPRLPDVYNGLRAYRPQALGVPCCSTLNCTDQSCKICSDSERWHPERLRHFRLRAARYNALLD